MTSSPKSVVTTFWRTVVVGGGLPLEVLTRNLAANQSGDPE
jgi:hypothetical protein